MGNIPVPGCVTSVRNRDSFKQEKYKLMKSKQAEEERLKELKKSQEEVMKFMMMKKKMGGEESSSSSRRFREEGGSGSRKDEHESRRDRRDAERRHSRSPRRHRDGSRSPRRRRGEEYENRHVQDRVEDSDGEEEEQAGAWEEVERKETSRKSPLTSAFAIGKDGGAEQKRKTKLAGAFGFDEEDDDARRTLEFAAASAAKRAANKRSIFSSGGPSMPASSTGGGLDAHAALKAMADFKRKCNGATRQIPDELKAMVMQVSRHSG